MANFDIAYGITKENEGGYHPGTGVNSADRGGETFKGIARKSWPNWAGWKLIDGYKNQSGFPTNALRDSAISQLVKGFYKREFWDINKLSDLKTQCIANELFDTGVNVGTGTAAKWLQRSINLLNRKGLNWKNIEVDGKIGPITLGMVDRMSSDDINSLFNLLNIIQGSHYVTLAEKDESQEVFIRGWVKRVEIMK